MISRRLFHGSLLGAALGVRAVPTAAQQEASSEVNLLEEWGFVGPNPPASAVGEKAPRAEEVQTAFRLMIKAPAGHDVAPIDVAQYFRSLETQNQQGELYREEWGERANPVITGFFTLTNIKPYKGDLTPWCAAFANWCLAASDRNVSFSAAAQSFYHDTKHFTTVDASPSVGDLVVFSRLVSGSRATYGHVGFLSRPYNEGEGGVWIIGGNQHREDGQPSGGIVSEVLVPFDHPTLSILSFKRPTNFEGSY